MGNAHIKPHPRVRNKKQVHWKAADRSAPPGKPELLPEAEVTPDLVTLRWSRPINDGGSPISGYLVEHRRVGSPHWVRATPLPVPFPEITLSGLEPGWRYQFRVSAENAVGYSDPSEVSEPITVTLQRSAVTAPKFTQEVEDTSALENEKCEFIVHFLGQPAPKVCWFKDGFEIFSSRRIRILTEHDRSILTIHQTSLSDEGEIKCSVTNKAGHVSTKAKLTVEAPPSIRLPRNYEEGLLFEMGEVIRLKVSVAGRPTPLVIWTHNGESLQNNDRFDIEFADKSFSLKIADAKRSDRGEYQIKAVNKLGEDSASFLVTVTDKPSPPGKAKVVMTLGRSVTLQWTSPTDDGGCKIGNYIVEYYRLGWNVWLKAATSRQLTTRLGDLIEGSEYKFRIKAESPYGISDPSEESEVIFIPDLKRGLSQPSRSGNQQDTEFFEAITSPTAMRRNKKIRSQSSSRAEEESGIPPVRPKRSKSKSQQQTPESSPMLPRKEISTQINNRIFDRASLARDLAYGTPDIKLPKDIAPYGLINEKKLTNEKSNVADHAIYKVTIEQPKDEIQISDSLSPQMDKRKLIRDQSGGSSEFMLVLYPDENNQGMSDLHNFDENSMPPPMSLSAPELASLEEFLFPGIRNSASSSELLHEKAMMRFYETAQAEEMELESRKQYTSHRKNSIDVPKIQINSQDSDIIGLDSRHSLRSKSQRKGSVGSVGSQQAKWAQKRHSLKAPAEIKADLFSSNLKRADDMTIQTSVDKPYTQSSFERKPVTFAEEQKWKTEYEESLSESESESESEIERFKYEINYRAQKVHTDQSFDEEETTYRPVGGLSDMKVINKEPFEILTKKKEPNPNFIPKPILKKTDSPGVSPTLSPTVSPPPSPTAKTSRALSPRPDMVLQRNRSKSLAVPVLPPLTASSGEESDEPVNGSRNRSFSLTADLKLPSLRKDTSKKAKNNTTLPNISSKKQTNNATLPSISAMAEITGITAASVIIPKKLLEKKAMDEEAKVVVDNYDLLVKSVGQRRSSNPFLKRPEIAEPKPVKSPEMTKEKSPSSENLSQDSGFQSVSSYRRSSFTDHYDTFAKFRSPVRKPPEPRVAASQMSDISDVTRVQKQNNTVYEINTNIPNIRGSIQTPERSISPHRPTTPNVVENRPQRRHRRSVTRSKSPTKRGMSVTRKDKPPEPAAHSVSKQTSTTTCSTLFPKRHPMLREIMTQTSDFLESLDLSIGTRHVYHSGETEVKVRSAIDWLMDSAMFAVACWLYLFENELLAIPVLLIMVYRQLQHEINKRIPNFIKKRWNTKPKE
ncbi:uncharacterized protein LOC126740395 isoform X2 [Anthonomus grandis grandis]|uniref:uncharacterized protein LOC126740395 isoform X2 n=1 Tax=Anthonomus grandis grandis TaxID=2921223 RepID=UPI00216577F0|nr:uncharacterized protein LOC126740395 isoform X2 [Anthonomus grandis grandis]